MDPTFGKVHIHQMLFIHYNAHILLTVETPQFEMMYYLPPQDTRIMGLNPTQREWMYICFLHVSVLYYESRGLRMGQFLYP
jgi:hypothetical protein